MPPAVPTPCPAGFTPTRWSLVGRAAHPSGDASGALRALDALAAAYWPPLYLHARRRALAPADAEDAVQSFLGDLLRPGAFAHVAPSHGPFRAWLRGAFNHHLADLHRHARAAKRGAHLRPPLDHDATTAILASAPDPDLPPDLAFDRAWACQLLRTVADRLADEHTDTPEHTALFAALAPLLAGRDSAAPQAELAARLGLTEPALRVALHRLRQRYRLLLRAEIALTVSHPDEVDAEFRHLLAALAPGNAPQAGAPRT